MTLPKGKLTPVVVKTEVIERVVQEKVESSPSIVHRQPVVYKQDVDIQEVLSSLKSDPTFLESIRGEKGERGEKGQPGLGAGGEGASQQKPTVNYTKITSATYTVEKKKLISGHNIFGVNYNGAVTITLPSSVHYEQLIYVKDESGNAATNNITIVQA
jgi:hypothetical protein